MQRTPAPPVPRPASFTCSRGDDCGDREDAQVVMIVVIEMMIVMMVVTEMMIKFL